MRELIIGPDKFKVDPEQVPFMTGFTKSLGDMFYKPGHNIKIIKQLLIAGTHYTTYSLVESNNERCWVHFDKVVIVYDSNRIEDADYIYYKLTDGVAKVVARRAFLQSSEHYHGIPGGIFANELNSDLVQTNSITHSLMRFLTHQPYYYLAYGSFVGKQELPESWNNVRGFVLSGDAK